MFLCETCNFYDIFLKAATSPLVPPAPVHPSHPPTSHCIPNYRPLESSHLKQWVGWRGGGGGKSQWPICALLRGNDYLGVKRITQHRSAAKEPRCKAFHYCCEGSTDMEGTQSERSTSSPCCECRCYGAAVYFCCTCVGVVCRNYANRLRNVSKHLLFVNPNYSSAPHNKYLFSPFWLFRGCSLCVDVKRLSSIQQRYARFSLKSLKFSISVFFLAS